MVYIGISGNLLRRYGFGFVIADTAGKLSYAEHVTARFVYGWPQEGRDVYVYFDDDARGRATSAV